MYGSKDDQKNKKKFLKWIDKKAVYVLNENTDDWLVVGYDQPSTKKLDSIEPRQKENEAKLPDKYVLFDILAGNKYPMDWIILEYKDRLRMKKINPKDYPLYISGDNMSKMFTQMLSGQKFFNIRKAIHKGKKRKNLKKNYLPSWTIYKGGKT
jgi:hypothetical protein